jgi:hypothetical protein
MRSPALLVCLLGSLLAAGPAGAQPSQQPLILAMQHYDLAEYAAARDGLTGAIATYQAAGDEGRPLLVRAHLLLGVVYANGFHDDGKAVEELAAALAIEAGATLDAPYASEHMGELFAKARADLAARAAPAPPAAPAVVDCGSLEGIAHTSVDSAAHGAATRIECQVGDSLHAGSVGLYYRSGKGGFAEIEMTRAQGCTYAAELPGAVMSGDTVEYYIAAKTAAGKLAAGRGSAQAPFVIDVAPAPAEVEEKVGSGGEAEEDEIPRGLTAKPPAPPRGGCGHCEVGAGRGAAPSGLWLLGLGLAAVSLARRRRG